MQMHYLDFDGLFFHNLKIISKNSLDAGDLQKGAQSQKRRINGIRRKMLARNDLSLLRSS